MQHISLATTKAPTPWDACQFIGQLDADAVKLDFAGDRAIAELRHDGYTTNLMLSHEPLDSESASLLAHYLQGRATDVIDHLQEYEDFAHVGAHLLLVMLIECADLSNAVRAEITEELGRRGYAVPRQERFLPDHPRLSL